MNSSHYLILGFSLVCATACGLDPNAPQDQTQAATSQLSTTQPSTTQTSLGSDDDPTSGDTGSNNAVEACQELEDTLAACVPAIAGTLQCSTYDEWPCDLSAYFDCISGAYGSCSGGSFPNVDPLTLQDCAALSVCN